ncbi:bifunctional metallophosphatase/5'-nucleotidase [Micromonospora mirobrigensis]|uniref:5'-nucleotidase n=1 Tax=Micromonospora mirobrigensis TaxID=262898 RepID=A0A1C4ZN29_9ACTN|nr:bifunctional metallophosphatase/5'-nucleotidase [Micromonospora mirobrigensis]SCF34289.1 5'-nucleotidase [Micromonospora mirobrigensis]
MSIPGMRRAAYGLTALAVTALGSVAVAPDQADARPKPVDVKLLAINDFHGNLEPPSGSSGSINGVPAGGVEYLATELAKLRGESKKEQRHTITVAAGDLIGASPLLSAAFHDEPTIEALNLAGLDFASVGNHEFDEGAGELLRIQNGGCHPVDGCADGTPYLGANFQYLSANAFKTATGQPLLPPYAVKKVDGVKVGFIGMTLEGTPDIVSQAGTAGLSFADEAETANRYARILRAKGVQSIVVLLHEGGQQSVGTDINGCNGFSGPIVDIVNRMDPSIDAVVSGHTHQAYNCEINGKLVTSASSFGRLVTDIDLKIDRKTGDVLTATANNVVVTRDVAKDPAQTDLISRYKTALGPVATKVVGSTSTAIPRAQEVLTGTCPADAPGCILGESPLGNLIADAQLAATDNEQGAVAAFMNPGGVRADLDAGPVTYEEAFTVQPFTNNLVTLDLTGAQLYCMLEQQFGTKGKTLQPSSTVSYVFDPAGTSAPTDNPCAGTRVVRGSLTIGGTPVDTAATYRVTVNNFLAGGGDGFSVLKGGTNLVTGAVDLDAFIAYLGEKSPVSAPTDNRIRTTAEVPAA